MLFYIYDEDLRYKYLGEYLLQKNYVKTIKLNEADIVILPFLLNLETFDLEEMLCNLKKDAKVFVGVKNDILRKTLNEKNIELYEIMEDKAIVVQNSIATAEGVIHFVIENINKTIYDSTFLILGNGFCGERIVKNLTDLGGDVTVFDRNEFKLRKANLQGANTVKKVDNLNYDVVINTIPNQVIENNLLNKESLIIDIASKPYGFDLQYAKDNKINVNVLSKIPSKFAVKTSGYILGEFIYYKCDDKE